MYTGKTAAGAPEKNQAKHVVLKMMAGLQGQSIICENFFTKKTTIAGAQTSSCTTDHKGKGLILPSGRHSVVLQCLKRRRNFPLMNTLNRDNTVSTSEDRKPNVFLGYNRNKGRVNNLDKVCLFLSLNSHTTCFSITTGFYAH